MSRIAAAVLAVAVAGLTQAPVVATSALAATAQSPARSAAQSPVRSAAQSTSRPRSSRPRRPSTSKGKPHLSAPGVPVPVLSSPRATRNCPSEPGAPKVTREPWPQQALDFSSAWNLAQGYGVTVAVVDSGVDYTPQLAGKVTAIDLTRTGQQDCVGHGTAVASIIAASDFRARGMPFAGVAPGARILSVKVNSGEFGKRVTLAQGIHDAAFLGARVINVSVTSGNTSELRAAVGYALSRNAVIVAAGGNDGTQSKGPFYPASYPGVLSVGAVQSNGALAPFSDLRSRAAVTAPGVGITSAWPVGYQTSLNGTSFAAAFVSGVAALVRSRDPALTEAQVVHRIRATADGGAGPGTGRGLVNPLQAVSAILPAGSGAAAPSAQPAPVSVAKPSVPDRAARAVALAVTFGLLGAAALVAVGAMVISQGRRRRWRAARARIPVD